MIVSVFRAFSLPLHAYNELYNVSCKGLFLEHDAKVVKYTV